MKYATAPPFHVSTWWVEPALNRLSQGDQAQQLEPKVMEVLVYLAEKPGVVVTRDELREQLWPGVVVSEKAVSRAVGALRKAFDDDWQQPHYIETISKTGYRLIAPVRRGEDRLQPAPSAPDALPRPSPLWPLAAAGIAAIVLLLFGLAWISHLMVPTPLTTLTPVPATTLPGAELGPALSPDGTQMAFAWVGPDEDNWDIYVKVIGAENPVRLTDDPDYEGAAAWSPDGRYVAFARVSENDCGLYQVPSIGGPSVRLGTCFSNPFGNLAWSSDGKHLAFSNAPAPQESARIYVLDLQAQALQALTLPPDGYPGDRYPAFSPDGRHVAFVRIRADGLSDLFRVPVEGGTPTQLTFDNRAISDLDWMPDGEQILFASNRSGLLAFWRVDANGGRPTWVPLNEQDITEPSVSPGRLLFTKFTDDTNIWALPLDRLDSTTTIPKRIVASTRVDHHPQVSPDGQKLAFSSNRSGYYEIWTSDFDGTNLIQHTRFEGPLVGPPRWSPDGQQVLFDARPDGHADLYVVDAESRQPRRLTEEPSDEQSGVWSQDGQWIYFSSNRDGPWQIWKMPARGGAAVPVTQQGGFFAQEHPDGRTLYFTKHDTLGIWQMPVQGGPERLVLGSVGSWDWGSWAVADEGLYFIQRGPTALALYRFDTQQITRLHTPAQPLPVGPALALSPDGQWLVFSKMDSGGADLLLVEKFH